MMHDELGKTITIIQKLANGIDPISHTKIENEHVLNQPEIIRALFHAAYVLENHPMHNSSLKEETGINSSNLKIRTEPWECIIPFSSLSEITDWINQRNGIETDATVFNDHILKWLEEMGIFEYSYVNEYDAYLLVTELGKENGFVSDLLFHDVNGHYVKYKLMERAQLFVIEHFNELLTFLKENDDSLKYHGTKWLSEHEQVLVDLYKKRVPIQEISVTLKRSDGGVRSKLISMGLMQTTRK